MTRDVELIRLILLEVERKATTRAQAIVAPGYSPEQVNYHVELLLEAGYLHGVKMAQFGWHPTSLTWAGHEFLDATRSESVWQQVKARLKDRGVDAPLTVIQELAAKIAASMLGLG